MARKTASSAARLGRQWASLSVATPQVVAQRLARMAAAGVQPNARERAEMQRMTTEKFVAVAASWQAMTLQALRVQQRLIFSWLTPRRTLALAPTAAARLQTAALGVLSAGLAPVQRAATANARRLARRRR
jgi:hypothetical protein